VPEETVDVLVASYLDLAGARPDFDALRALIRDNEVTTGYGVILVAKDPDGTVTLAGTGDDLGRQTQAWGVGVGLVIGLFSPAVLASILTGRPAGGPTGTSTGHTASSSRANNLGDRLIPGTAALIAVIDSSSQPAAARALTGALTNWAAPIAKNNLDELKDPLAQAIAKFHPHHPVLPIPGRSPSRTLAPTPRQPAASRAVAIRAEGVPRVRGTGQAP
jgi:arylsulfatase